MARPQKVKLDYFPLDADIFGDDKLFDVQNEYGPLGEVIYLRLLCMIYKNGYYLKYESLDKLASMLIKSIGNRWVRDKQIVIQVIPFLAKCNLFSLELMQENVLTSVGIQERYLKATERRQSQDKKYWLIGEKADAVFSVPKNQINDSNNSINIDINSENDSDNPQSKGKEINNNNSIIICQSVVDIYHETCTELPKVLKLTDKRERAIKKLMKDMVIDDIRNGFIAINQSNFCKGINDTGWKATFDFCIKPDSIIKALEGKYSNKGGVNRNGSNGTAKCSNGNTDGSESGCIPNSGFRR